MKERQKRQRCKSRLLWVLWLLLKESVEEEKMRTVWLIVWLCVTFNTEERKSNVNGVS